MSRQAAPNTAYTPASARNTDTGYAVNSLSTNCRVGPDSPAETRRPKATAAHGRRPIAVIAAPAWTPTPKKNARWGMLTHSPCSTVHACVVTQPSTNRSVNCTAAGNRRVIVRIAVYQASAARNHNVV